MYHIYYKHYILKSRDALMQDFFFLNQIEMFTFGILVHVSTL